MQYTGLLEGFHKCMGQNSEEASKMKNFHLFCIGWSHIHYLGEQINNYIYLIISNIKSSDTIRHSPQIEPSSGPENGSESFI